MRTWNVAQAPANSPLSYVSAKFLPCNIPQLQECASSFTPTLSQVQFEAKCFEN